MPAVASIPEYVNIAGMLYLRDPVTGNLQAENDPASYAGIPGSEWHAEDQILQGGVPTGPSQAGRSSAEPYLNPTALAAFLANPLPASDAPSTYYNPTPGGVESGAQQAQDAEGLALQSAVAAGGANAPVGSTTPQPGDIFINGLYYAPTPVTPTPAAQAQGILSNQQSLLKAIASGNEPAANLASATGAGGTLGSGAAAYDAAQAAAGGSDAAQAAALQSLLAGVEAGTLPTTAAVAAVPGTAPTTTSALSLPYSNPVSSTVTPTIVQPPTVTAADITPQSDASLLSSISNLLSPSPSTTTATTPTNPLSTELSNITGSTGGTPTLGSIVAGNSPTTPTIPGFSGNTAIPGYSDIGPGTPPIPNLQMPSLATNWS
jgi:hypothetical protein